MHRMARIPRAGATAVADTDAEVSSEEPDNFPDGQQENR